MSEAKRPRKKAPKRCKRCKKTGKVNDPLSRRGLHFECGKANQIEAIYSMAGKSGPAYEKWQRAMLKSLQNGHVRMGVLQGASEPVSLSARAAR